MRFRRKFPGGSVIDSLAFLYRVLYLLCVNAAFGSNANMVCWYIALGRHSSIIHVKKNEFQPPPPDELGNFSNNEPVE